VYYGSKTRLCFLSGCNADREEFSSFGKEEGRDLAAVAAVDFRNGSSRFSVSTASLRQKDIFVNDRTRGFECRDSLNYIGKAAFGATEVPNTADDERRDHGDG